MPPRPLVAWPSAACLLLSACASVVPMTAARLATVDPLTADPAAITLVVILPPGMAVTPGSAVLEFDATRSEETLAGRFTLKDSAVPPEARPQEGSARAFALTEVDAGRMRALQHQIAEWKREGAAKGQLGLGIGGCALGEGPAPDAAGSVLIRLERDGPFLPLIREARLAELLGPDALAAIGPCKGAE